MQEDPSSGGDQLLGKQIQTTVNSKPAPQLPNQHNTEKKHPFYTSMFIRGSPSALSVQPWPTSSPFMGAFLSLPSAPPPDRDVGQISGQQYSFECKNRKIK